MIVLCRLSASHDKLFHYFVFPARSFGLVRYVSSNFGTEILLLAFFGFVETHFPSPFPYAFGRFLSVFVFVVFEHIFFLLLRMLFRDQLTALVGVRTRQTHTFENDTAFLAFVHIFE
jgi:hypothetical protein